MTIINNNNIRTVVVIVTMIITMITITVIIIIITIMLLLNNHRKNNKKNKNKNNNNNNDNKSPGDCGRALFCFFLPLVLDKTHATDWSNGMYLLPSIFRLYFAKLQCPGCYLSAR